MKVHPAAVDILEKIKHFTTKDELDLWLTLCGGEFVAAISSTNTGVYGPGNVMVAYADYRLGIEIHVIGKNHHDFVNVREFI